jgi:hypothetical protein
MRLPSVLRRLTRDSLPFDMFDMPRSDAEARRARRMESIYHVGQHRIWDGREVLAELVAKHGAPRVPPEKRKPLAKVFAIIMWGELAAWKISAQLADALVPLEARLAATSQAHDEARHFYVMHDYLEALGEKPERMGFWSQRVLELTLGTDDLLKKLLGMQLTVETIALVIFQRVRELEIEPVLTELLPYYERDEARHVGLGVQLVPQMMNDLSIPGIIDVALFQLDMLSTTLFALKAIEPELVALGVDPRSMLGIAFRKQDEIDSAIKKEFPLWPEDPPVRRVFEGLCEVLFPSEGPGARVPLATRLAHGVQVVSRARESVVEAWGKEAGTRAGRSEKARAANAA